MIERKCETCEQHRTGRICYPCTPTDLRNWKPNRNSLVGELSRTKAELEMEQLRHKTTDAERLAAVNELAAAQAEIARIKAELASERANAEARRRLRTGQQSEKMKP